ncbi:class I SAM-dependent methyltransferase [Desulfococcaceae bacterium HSG8]|nr:class I SAM-dependent methyltransferase [Desulfococcaceae bacterium HSG8]
MNITQAKKILGEHFGFMAEDANKAVQYLKLPSDAKILDVGTGLGYFAIVLALNGYSVLTGEPESDNSIYAKRDWSGNFQKAGVDNLIKFQTFDSRGFPFDDNSFDAIFFFSVLHHIDEDYRTKVLQESARISGPGAVVCFFEPNENGIKIIMEHDPSHPEPADPAKYTQGTDLSLEKTKGVFFDCFIFRINDSVAR